MRLYGIKTCDTCRKALKAIQAAELAVEFCDIRETPLTEAQLTAFFETLGPALLNTRSSTWRALSEVEREDIPVALLTRHPTLMKRPVIDREGRLTLGWAKNVQAEVLGNA